MVFILLIHLFQFSYVSFNPSIKLFNSISKIIFQFFFTFLNFFLVKFASRYCIFYITIVYCSYSFNFRVLVHRVTLSSKVFIRFCRFRFLSPTCLKVVLLLYPSPPSRRVRLFGGLTASLVSPSGEMADQKHRYTSARSKAAPPHGNVCCDSRTGANSLLANICREEMGVSVVALQWSVEKF